MAGNTRDAKRGPMTLRERVLALLDRCEAGRQDNWRDADPGYWIGVAEGESAGESGALDRKRTLSCGHTYTLRHTACPTCFAEMRGEPREAATVLREVEWSGVTELDHNHLRDVASCPVCEGVRPDDAGQIARLVCAGPKPDVGHVPGCRFAAALAKAEGR